MHVRVKAFGPLRTLTGADGEQIELPTGATLADLLRWIGEHWAERLPPSAWNTREHRFRGPVVVRVGAQVVRDRATVLADGQEVGIHQALVGG